MRIVVVTETFVPHVDGIVTRLTNTIHHLIRSGDDVLIVAPRTRGVPLAFEGARVLSVPSVSLPQYPGVRLSLPLLPPGVARDIMRFQPDVIHVAAPATLGLGAILLARFRHVPLLASYHVQFEEYVARYGFRVLVPFVRWYLPTLHNSARLNLATSRPMVRGLRRSGYKRTYLWGPGVDAEHLHPSKASAAMRERLSDGHPNDLVLLCASRLAVEKQIDRLAPALRAVPGTRLALAGDGPARERLEQAFAGLPVTFLGMLHGDELAAAYASADLFVMPSSTETLGLVALEAMAAGVPVVAANRGGLPDLVADGQTGLLFDPDRPDHLSACIVALKEDETRRREMALAARRYAEQCSWARTTRQLQGYYARALGQANLPDDDLAEELVPAMALPAE
jgi:glycosyltransferase involved in cell wall biosynthesis